MKLRSQMIAAAAIMTLSPIAVFADDCRYSREIEKELAADAEATIDIVAKAGRLEVTGKRGSTVRVKGLACASNQQLLDDMDIELAPEGNGILAAAHIPEIKGGWGTRYAYLHLDIEVPAQADLSVKDSSGNLVIRDVGALELQDSSGNIEVFNVTGDLDIRDSSGGIEVADVGGDVSVTDSSGNIDIRTVGGIALIENDSSGNIEIRDVMRDVVVRNDSSGDIDIGEVGGLVQIDRDSSGGIMVNDVGGDVTVGRDSSGNITAKRVRGDFVVEHDSGGRINYSDIQGSVSTPVD